MSEEWSINWDVVDQKLQAILEELKAEVDRYTKRRDAIVAFSCS